jgi:DNA polymerase-3 subunit alpha
MAALLSYESQAKKVEDWVPYLQECGRIVFPDSTTETPHIGVEVRPPDVNLSEEDFSVVFADEEVKSSSTGHVRFGLQAIKGIPREAIRGIVTERQAKGPFESLHEFCERIDHSKANQKACESLIRAGALDSIHGVEARAAMVSALPGAYTAGRSYADDRSKGQNMLFGGGETEEITSEEPNTSTLPAVEPWDQLTRLAQEKETLGFHFSGHPLDQFTRVISEYCSANTDDIAELPPDTPVVFAGVISRVRPVHTRKGQRMAMITLTDKFGVIDGVVFPETYAKYADLLQIDEVVILIGQVETGRGERNIVVDRVVPIEQAASNLATKLEIRFVEPKPGDSEGEPVRQRMQLAAGVLKQAAGNSAVQQGQAVDTVIHLELADGGCAVLVSHGLQVIPHEELISQLRGVAGVDGIRVRGGWRPARKESRRRFPRAS